ncbi:MAG: hypothetical protein Q8R97_12560, partial [Brevundimonas sp.]|nr:hypothetical protein [Brevundimonas sp.]
IWFKRGSRLHQPGGITMGPRVDGLPSLNRVLQWNDTWPGQMLYCYGDNDMMSGYWGVMADGNWHRFKMFGE